jgi:hypothetical protein
MKVKNKQLDYVANFSNIIFEDIFTIHYVSNDNSLRSRF